MDFCCHVTENINGNICTFTRNIRAVTVNTTYLDQIKIQSNTNWIGYPPNPPPPRQCPQSLLFSFICGSRACPGNIGNQAGLYPGCNANTWQDRASLCLSRSPSLSYTHTLTNQSSGPFTSNCTQTYSHIFFVVMLNDSVKLFFWEKKKILSFNCTWIIYKNTWHHRSTPCWYTASFGSKTDTSFSPTHILMWILLTILAVHVSLYCEILLQLLCSGIRLARPLNLAPLKIPPCWAGCDGFLEWIQAWLQWTVLMTVHCLNLAQAIHRTAFETEQEESCTCFDIQWVHTVNLSIFAHFIVHPQFTARLKSKPWSSRNST